MHKLILFSLTFLFFFSGCNSTNNYVVKEEYIEVNGEHLIRDEKGNLIISKEQLAFLKGKSDIIVLDSVLPGGGIAVSKTELNLLTKNPKLLTETLDSKVMSNDVYSFLIKRGSLKENLERLALKYTTDEDPLSLDYGDLDYFVSESKIVKAASIEEVISKTLDSFPLFTSIDGYTFFIKKGSLKENLKRLSDKYSTDRDHIELEYNHGDFYVSKTQLLRAESIEELLAIILEPFPVFGTID